MAEQPIAVANDQEYGQRKELAAGQAAARIKRADEPLPGGGRGGGPMGAGGPPSDLGSLFARPSDRPMEPHTAGMDMGPGPGSEVLATRPTPTDDRELLLEYLAEKRGNSDAKAMLDAMRMPPPAPVMPALGGSIGPGGPIPAPMGEEDPDFMAEDTGFAAEDEDLAAEEDLADDEMVPEEGGEGLDPFEDLG